MQKGLDCSKYSYIDRLVARIERPIFEREQGGESEEIARIFVFVYLPRYLIETRDELRDAVLSNKAAIDHMVQDKIETEPQFQKLGIPFHLLSLSKCTLRVDYILEYLFQCNPQPAIELSEP